MERASASSFVLGRGLYGIADMGLIEAAGMTLEEAVLALLHAGAPVVQLRNKRGGGGEMLEQSRLLARLCRQRGAVSVVNDRVDVALAAGAGGVHLGQEDLPVSAARAMLPRGAVIGWSTHGPEQVRAALDMGADYIGFGPVFPTSTKENPDPLVGTQGLAEAVALAAGRMPVVAIGGIELPSVPEMARAGADLVAVVSDILQHHNPGRRAMEVNRAMAEEGCGS